jgi:L-fuconolactonase
LSPREPSIEIVDAHHHLWDLSTGWYDWPTPAEVAIYRTFAASELAGELAIANVARTVVVQTIDRLEDTDAMIGARAAHPWIAGVVGWVPLADRDAAERELAARASLLAGVRHLIHREPDPHWILRPDVADGLDVVAALGLPFDVVAVFPHHLELLPALRRRHPDLVLVIDHLAKPPYRSDGWATWAAQLREAGSLPGVYAKISGLDTAAGPGWTPDELRPGFDIALEAFGPERLLFGSDWPVCRLASTYAEVVAAARALVAELAADEQAEILGGTAARVYGLGPAA